MHPNSLGEDLLFNSTVLNCEAKVCFISYAGYHYIQRKRETLGVKYYENFFELKQKAIEAKCSILRNWEVPQALIDQFCDNYLVDIAWGAIKNIQKSVLSKKQKIANVKSLVKESEIFQKLHIAKVLDKRRKIKKIVLLFCCSRLLLKIV